MGVPNIPVVNSMNGLYLFCIYSELLFKYVIIMLQKLPDKLDSFHFLYDKDIIIHTFFLKILKYIFRSILFKERQNKEYVVEFITRLKKPIFKLIMFLIKQSSTHSLIPVSNYYPMDYLSFLKIIFKSIVRIENFFKFFTSEIKDKHIRILDYFIQLYKSNIEELKVISTELVLLTPFEVKFFLSKYPEYAKDFIPIIIFALTLQDSFVILRAIQAIDHIINSSSLLKEEVLILLEPNSNELFQNLKALITIYKQKSYFLKSSVNQDSSIIIASLKTLAKLSPFIRNLNIPTEFNIKSEYILELEQKEDKLKVLQSKNPSTERSIFEIEITENERTFKFNTFPTLMSIFKTLDILDSKVTLYYYLTVSPNLMFVSTLKHCSGLEKFSKFLKLVLNVMMFKKNDDIEIFFKEQAEQSKMPMKNDDEIFVASTYSLPRMARDLRHLREQASHRDVHLAAGHQSHVFGGVLPHPLLERRGVREAQFLPERNNILVDQEGHGP